MNQEDTPDPIEPNLAFRVNISKHRTKISGVHKMLRTLAISVLKMERSHFGSVEITLSDDLLLRELNKQWRNLDKTTDVLSFPFEESDFLGEIYISVPQVLRQSETYQCTPGEELFRVTLHGVLHLLGYDHITTPQRKIMRALEAKYTEMFKHYICEPGGIL
jgi:rRNA maturation RNase YbeY